MTTKKVSYLLIAFFLFALKVTGQTDPPPPPPMAMPKDSSFILVDKIIEVTKHEKYYVDYCTKKVENYSKENFNKFVLKYQFLIGNDQLCCPFFLFIVLEDQF